MSTFPIETPPYVQALLDAGFSELKSPEELEMLNFELGASEKSANGLYEVLAVLGRGAVRVTVEVNRARVFDGGVNMEVSYPPVAVVEGPRGRAACNPMDTELVLNVAADLDELGTG